LTRGISDRGLCRGFGEAAGEGEELRFLLERHEPQSIASLWVSSALIH
jgi:hypothetical protein